MARTSIADVKNIFDTSLSDPVLQAFIDDANGLVAQYLSGKGVSSSLLTTIEKYIAAHLASVRDPLETRVDRDDASATLEARARSVGAGTRGLSLTFYGQHAIVLDPTGSLQNLSRRRAFVKARGPWGDETDE